MWQKHFTFLLQAGNRRFPAMSVGPEVPRTMRAVFACEQMTRELRSLEPRASVRSLRSLACGAYVAHLRRAVGPFQSRPVAIIRPDSCIT